MGSGRTVAITVTKGRHVRHASGLRIRAHREEARNGHGQ